MLSKFGFSSDWIWYAILAIAKSFVTTMPCFSHSGTIRSDFFNVSTTTALDAGTCLFVANTKFFVSSSIWIRFEFWPTHRGGVFSASVSISAFHLISFFRASSSFSSIRFVKICFGLSKGSISGSLSFGFFLYGATSSPLGSYVRLSFLFLLFSITSSFVFQKPVMETEFSSLLKSVAKFLL